MKFLAHHGGEKSYYVGYSTPERHWSYVLPGPLDGWAGGGYWAGYHPRHFPSLYFRLDRVARQGDCRLTCCFVGVNDKRPPRIRVEINGHRFEQELQGENTRRLLTGEEEGHFREFHVDFPAEWLLIGMNRIRLGTVKGSWAVFDCIRLTTPDRCRMGEASSTLVRSAQSAPFEYERDGRRMLPVFVEMHQFDSPCRLTFELEGCPAVTRTSSSKPRGHLLATNTSVRSRSMGVPFGISVYLSQKFSVEVCCGWR